MHGLCKVTSLSSGLGHHCYLDIYTILVLDKYLVLVNYLVFQFVAIAFSCACSDINFLALEVVCQGNCSVHLQFHLLGVWFRFLCLSLGGLACRLLAVVACKTLVGLLQIWYKVVQFFEVECTLERDVPPVGYVIAETCPAYAVSALPVVCARITHVGCQPLEYRHLVEWQGICGAEILLVAQRTSKVHEAGLHRILPHSIFVGVMILVHRQEWLLHLGICSGAQVHLQVSGRIPLYRERAVPVELLREGERYFLIAGNGVEVAALQFMIVACDVRVQCK